MCKCTPSIRTLYCGKADCVWPDSNKKSPFMKNRPYAEHKVWLTNECNRLLNGECNTAKCLARGGHCKGDKVDYRIATCIPYEIHQILSGKKE